jgi:hypothetical protein
VLKVATVRVPGCQSDLYKIDTAPNVGSQCGRIRVRVGGLTAQAVATPINLPCHQTATWVAVVMASLWRTLTWYVHCVCSYLTIGKGYWIQGLITFAISCGFREPSLEASLALTVAPMSDTYNSATSTRDSQLAML